MSAKPWRQRYPNEWCTKSVVYTPERGRVEATTRLAPEAGALLIALLVTTPNAEQRATMTTLADSLLPRSKVPR